MSEMDSKPVRLTQTSKKGGCAAKLPAGTLRAVLADLKLKRPEALLVGTETMDDASLWKLGNGELLIQTLDFFTPIVDDARDFGAIAAVNALSDVYAMGGRPITALTILAFPTSVLDLSLIGPLLEGATQKIEESGACLCGGHSIDDETLKLGFSVAGLVNENRAWTNAGAKPGDKLILTKALGTGTLSTAIKTGDAKADWVNAAIESMKRLNNAPELLDGIAVNAATDVTGFGLAGHLQQMMRASLTSARVELARLPILPGAQQCIQEEFLNRAHHTNKDYCGDAVMFSNPSHWRNWLALDPQTSGGLLLSVKPEHADGAVERLRERFPSTAIIGEVGPLEPVLVSFI
jgi:selenide,water dikinase